VSRLNGIGFVLKQEIHGIWRPVQAGSQFFTETEEYFAMVEMELLAICWAAKKCASYIDGLPLKTSKLFDRSCSTHSYFEQVHSPRNQK
jgi:hypothetical protein